MAKRAERQAYNQLNMPFVPPPQPPYRPEQGDWIRARTMGYVPLVSPIPGDVTQPQQLAKYALLAKFPIVKAALDTIIAGVFWSKWEIAPGNDYAKYPEYEALDKHIIARIQDQIAELEYDSFENSIRALLWGGMVYGITNSEIIFNDEADRERRGGEVRVVAIKAKAPSDFQLWVDPVGNLDRLYYLPTGTFIEQEAMQKFIIAPYPRLQPGGNYYGTSELQSIIQDIELLIKLEEFQARISANMAGRPIILHVADQLSPSEKNAYQQALFDVQSTSLVSFPARIDNNKDIFQKLIELEVLEDRASPNGIEQIQLQIERLQKRIPRTLGVPDDLGMTDTGSGSYAKSRTELDLLMSRFKEKQDWLAGVVTRQVFYPMYVYNWATLPDTWRPPVFRFTALDEAEQQIAAERSIMLYEKGIITQAEVREALDMEAAPEEIRQDEIGSQPDEEIPEGGASVTTVSEETVLNGAQITAATAIIQAVADGTLPRDSGIAQIQIFFNLTRGQAEAVMGSAGIKDTLPSEPVLPEEPVEPSRPAPSFMSKFLRYNRRG